MFLSIIASILELFSLSLFIPIVSKISEFSTNVDQVYFGKKFIEFYEFTLNEFIIFSFILIISVYLIKNLILAIYYYFLAQTSHGINYFISNKLFKIYLYQDYIYHLNKNTSIILRNLTTESKNIASFTMSMLNLVADLIMVLFITIFLFIVNPLGCLVVISIILILGTSYFKITGNLIRNWGKNRQLFDGKKIKSIQETFKNIKEIILKDNKKIFQNKFSFFNKNVVTNEKNIMFLQSLPRLWLELFSIVGVLMLFLTNIYLGKNYTEIIIIFSIFGMALYRLMPISARIIQNIHALKYHKVSVNHISNELSELSNFVDQTDNEEFKEINEFHTIEFKDTTFTFSNNSVEKLIFSELNLKMKLNCFIGIKGRSGIGKTTFIDLISIILKPKSGGIYIDGTNINEYGLNWRKKIGYVSQKPLIFDDTIANNIAFGDDINNKKISDAIAISQLEDDIKGMKLGIQTMVGENGDNLSGGQLQRLIIARAVYNNKKILIFDEPTSSQDNYTRKKFMLYLKSIKENFTIILISHDETNFDYCDDVYEIFNENKIQKI